MKQNPLYVGGALNRMTAQISPFIDDNYESIIQRIITITSISSSPFEEIKKIKYIKKQLKMHRCLKHIAIDREGNLSAFLPGKKNKNVLLVAHTDTALKIKKNPVFIKNKYMYGHGVCDNTSGIVSLLTILKFLDDTHTTPFYNLTFLFTVGEEGIGGKRGMKYFLKHNKNIDVVINAESHDVGRITTSAVGQFRAKIEVICEKGGHSWRDFGNPNPICFLAHIITDLQKSLVFQKGETSYTFSVIEGGESINAIPTSASVLYEFRSLSQKKYNELKIFFNGTIHAYNQCHPAVMIKTKIITDSLPVTLDKNHPLIIFTEHIHNELKIKSFYKEGNTDGDVSLALGIPTVTIGTSIGHNTHSIKEYVEIDSFKMGYAQLLFMVNQLEFLCI